MSLSTEDLLNRAPSTCPNYTSTWVAPANTRWKSRPTGADLVPFDGTYRTDVALLGIPSGTWCVGASTSFVGLMFSGPRKAATVVVFDVNGGLGDSTRHADDFWSRAPLVETLFLELPEPGHWINTPQSAFIDWADELIFPVRCTDPEAAALGMIFWRPTEGRLKLVPLPWFNQNTKDLEWQGISRLIRDPRSGLIIGDGIRLADFVVNENGELLSGGLTR